MYSTLNRPVGVYIFAYSIQRQRLRPGFHKNKSTGLYNRSLNYWEVLPYGRDDLGPRYPDRFRNQRSSLLDLSFVIRHRQGFVDIAIKSYLLSFWNPVQRNCGGFVRYASEENFSVDHMHTKYASSLWDANGFVCIVTCHVLLATPFWF